MPTFTYLSYGKNKCVKPVSSFLEREPYLLKTKRVLSSVLSSLGIISLKFHLSVGHFFVDKELSCQQLRPQLSFLLTQSYVRTCLTTLFGDQSP
jgi:hypothetical protein